MCHYFGGITAGYQFLTQTTKHQLEYLQVLIHLTKQNDYNCNLISVRNSRKQILIYSKDMAVNEDERHSNSTCRYKLNERNDAFSHVLLYSLINIWHFAIFIQLWEIYEQMQFDLSKK